MLQARAVSGDAEMFFWTMKSKLCPFWEDDTGEDLQVDEDPAMGNWRKVVTGNKNSESEGSEAWLSLA